MGVRLVFGGAGEEICIPPAAFDEYGFRANEVICNLRGSPRSCGFSVACLEKLDDAGHLLL